MLLLSSQILHSREERSKKVRYNRSNWIHPGTLLFSRQRLLGARWSDFKEKAAEKVKENLSMSREPYPMRTYPYEVVLSRGRIAREKVCHHCSSLPWKIRKKGEGKSAASRNDHPCSRWHVTGTWKGGRNLNRYLWICFASSRIN